MRGAVCVGNLWAVSKHQRDSRNRNPRGVGAGDKGNRKTCGQGRDTDKGEVVKMFIVGVIAAAIVVLLELYGVSVFLALIVKEHRWYRWRKQFEEDENDDSDERGF